MTKEEGINRLFKHVNDEVENSGWWIFNKKDIKFSITRILEPHEKSANLPLPPFLKVDYITIDTSGINTGKNTTPWSEICASGIKIETIPETENNYISLTNVYLVYCRHSGRILEFPLSDITQFKGLLGHFIEQYKELYFSMDPSRIKITARTESANLSWGIYGFCEKIGWEDLNLFYEGRRIGKFCLNTKSYMRSGLDDLKQDPDEKEFVDAIEAYLEDDLIHYWYSYSDRKDKDFFEVSYDAPRNDEGVKPRFLDIWHPDEGIGLSTIASAVKNFARNFLGIRDCEVEVAGLEPFEESLQSYIKHQKLFGGNLPAEITFSDEIVDELSKEWSKPREEVLNKLNEAVKKY